MQDAEPAECNDARATVVVIDPDGAVRAVVRRMLEGLGYAVAEAAELQAGLAAIRGHAGRLALVLLDVLPAQLAAGGDLAAIQAASPGAPVALTSAGALIAARRWPAASGVIGALAKPFTQRDLAELLARPAPARVHP